MNSLSAVTDIWAPMGTGLIWLLRDLFVKKRCTSVEIATFPDGEEVLLSYYTIPWVDGPKHYLVVESENGVPILFFTRK